MRFIILISLFFLTGCEQKKVKKIYYKDYYEINHMLNDSVIHGLSQRYSLKGRLISETEYKFGNRNGYSKEYNESGSIKYHLNYLGDKLNNFQYTYDDDENIESKMFYFFGQDMGSRYTFDKNKISYFNFYDFNTKEIYACGYDTTGKINKFKGELLNAYLSDRNEEGIAKTRIFMYLIRPPHTSSKYYIGSRDNMKKDKIIQEITSQAQFIDTSLTNLSTGSQYFVMLQFNDSLNNFNKIYINTFK